MRQWFTSSAKTSRYSYTAAGERIIKSHGDLEGVYINCAPQGITFHETEDYTIYPAPIITVTKNRFTKHYFIGDKRVASKLGVGKFSNVYGISGNNITAGQKPLCHIAVPFSHLSWRKHAIAHVGSLIVVEIYDTVNDASCIIEILRSFHVVEPLLLYYSVHSFGDCIICRVVIFCHAYARVYTFQSFQIVHLAVQFINEGCCLKGSLLLGTSFF